MFTKKYEEYSYFTLDTGRERKYNLSRKGNMSRSFVKKFIALGVCLILLIGAAFLPFELKGYRAGTGNGTSANITELQEFSESLGTALKRVSVSKAEREFGTNATVEFTLNTYKSEGFVGVGVSFQHTIKAYLTEQATLFEIDTFYSSNATVGYLSAQLYLTLENTYLRCERLKSATAGVRFSLPDTLLDKWLDLSDIQSTEINDVLSYIDERHFSTLSVLSQFMEETKEGDFLNKGKSVVGTQAGMLRLAFSLLSMEGYDLEWETIENFFNGEVKVDFSNAKHPCFTFSIHSEAREFESVPLTIQKSGKLYLSNLSNTMIRMGNIQAVKSQEYLKYLEAVQI